MLTLPDDFFEEEVREGFTVSSEMKRAWAGEMKVLDLIADIAERYDILWHAAYGTLLGAVRHKGYIPWDDDIDIMAPRSQYRKLCRVLSFELPENYVLYENEFGEGHRGPFAAVCNRRHPDRGEPGDAEITGEYFGCPHIVGLDIFPVDRMPVDSEEYSVWSNLYSGLYDLAFDYEKYEREGSVERLLSQMEELAGISVPREGNLNVNIWNAAAKIASIYEEEESFPRCTMTRVAYGIRPERNTYQADLFEKTEYYPFETMSIPGPADYDTYLKMAIGADYMTPKRVGAGHRYPYWLDEEK